MKNPRKAHVGKSPGERKQYERLLKTKQAEDPTDEEYESTPTDSVVQEEVGKVASTPQKLKPYKPEHPVPWRDIMIGFITVAIVGVFGFFAMSLNREVGVLSEKYESTKSDVSRIEANYNSVRQEVEGVKIDVEVIKRNTGRRP
jgi:hypothetical protein